MLVVALLPILLAIPQLFWLDASPIYYTAGMTVERSAAILPGRPYADPNNGFQTQALGYRAVLDWLDGEVPWWNPYTGIGMPLAAEYQPAAFFPLTALVVLPKGMVLLQMTLQVLAGLGAFALARQLGLVRLAAVCFGAMYAVNGTLAWFSHAPAGVVPWLPWILLGIERARIAAATRQSGGWRILAAAMAMSLLAGFPETAYINGLLALAWAIVRGLSLREARVSYAMRIAAGGLTALAVASPQIVSFFLYLRDSHVGGHAGEFANSRLAGPMVPATIGVPYLMGPIYGFAPEWPALYTHWGGLGGYASAALVVAAIHGFVVRRDALGWLLVVWTLTSLGKSFGIEPFLSAWNLVPGVTAAAFARYAPPSWELALMLLAARGIHSLLAPEHVRGATSSALALGAAMAVVSVAYAAQVWNDIPIPAVALRDWFLWAMGWALASMVIVIAALRRRAARFLGGFLALEAAVLCAMPMLANTTHAKLDMPAVEYLRANIGLQRFYTLEPLEPNYGALFGIASINHNYLPVPEAWVQHVHANLDRTWTDAAVFNGHPGRNSVAELRRNLDAFQALGVKYVLARPGDEPLAGVSGVTLVYRSAAMSIFELPAPRPYFEDPANRCTATPTERRVVMVRCEAPSTLVRRELFFPGWSADVNGERTPIRRADGLFQAVDLPQGVSTIRYRYAPPHIGWAWLACFLGLTALAAPALLLLRRKHQ